MDYIINPWWFYLAGLYTMVSYHSCITNICVYRDATFTPV